MYGRVLGVAVLGVGGHLVTVEAHVGRGLPALIVTGLPGAGVQDARERVRPAVEGAELEWPLRRVVVNLAPANVRKEGPGLDLPLVMSVLAATGQIPHDRLRSVRLRRRGLAERRAALHAGHPHGGDHGRQSRASDGIVVPAANAVEAAQVEGLRVIGAGTLVRCRGIPPRHVDAAGGDACARRRAGRRDRRPRGGARPDAGAPCARGRGGRRPQPPDGRFARRRARRCSLGGCPTILPELSREESLEATQLHSVAGLLGASRGLLRARPFRSPHHSVSTVGLLGGGSTSRAPGRGEPRASRRPLPRRAHRVPPRRRRGIATAARGRPRRDHPRRGVGGVPGAVHARGRRQPVPVRVRRRRDAPLRLPPRPGAAVPQQALRVRCSTASTSDSASPG